MIKGLLLLLALASGPALAQQPVWTVPTPATSAAGNVSSTIAVTNTFQQVFAASQPSQGALPGAGGTRKGCTIINNAASNTMYVSEGKTAATAATASSVALAAGQAYYCNWNGTVLTGEIDITGTAGDAYYAAQY